MVKIKKVKDFKINESINLDDLDDLNDIFIDLIDFGFETDDFELNRKRIHAPKSIFKLGIPAIILTLKKVIPGSFGYKEIEDKIYGSTNIKSLKEEMDKTLDHLSEIQFKLKSLEYKFAFDFEISCEDDYKIWIYFRISK